MYSQAFNEKTQFYKMPEFDSKWLMFWCCCGGSSAIKFEPWSIFLDLKPDEFYYYPFIVSMNMCNGNCNTVEDPFNKIGVPIKTKDVNLKVLVLSK